MVDNSRTFKIILHTVLMLLAAFCLVPFLLLFSSSFSSEASLMKYGYSFFPREVSFAAYNYLFGSSSSIVRSYGITILVTVIGTTVNLVLTVLLAYPLSRKDLPYRNVFAFIIFFTMLFNGGLVPTYIMYTQLFHIKNTLFALIVPQFMLSAFYVIMMRTYFTTNIPMEIIEAAKIDGAHEYRILGQVVLPMSMPILATVGLMVGLMYWNAWTNGLYYLTDPKLFSIHNVLNRMLRDAQFLSTMGSNSGQLSTAIKNLPSTSLKMAVAVIGALPILVVYPFFQRFFVKGITVGAVKG
jgi:putative aldouronate transport system permease protein